MFGVDPYGGGLQPPPSQTEHPPPIIGGLVSHLFSLRNHLRDREKPVLAQFKLRGECPKWGKSEHDVFQKQPVTPTSNKQLTRGQCRTQKLGRGHHLTGLLNQDEKGDRKERTEVLNIGKKGRGGGRMHKKTEESNKNINTNKPDEMKKRRVALIWQGCANQKKKGKKKGG